MFSAIEEDRLVDPKRAAKLLGVAVQTLAIWRGEGKGPAFVRVGERMIRYRLSALEGFIQEGQPTAGDSSP